jgi:hypothetical protein
MESEKTIEPVIKMVTYYQQTLYFVCNKKLDYDQGEFIAKAILNSLSVCADSITQLLRRYVRGHKIVITFKVYPKKFYVRQRVVVELPDTSLILFHSVAAAEWRGECSFAASDEKFRRIGDSAFEPFIKKIAIEK